MPATSVAQQQAAGAELRRRRAGQAPRTFRSLPTSKLRHFAGTKHQGLPERAVGILRGAMKARARRKRRMHR